MRYLLLCLVVACIGCNPNVEPELVSNGAGAAAFAFTASANAIDRPEPKPDSDKCQNCDGKGKVGDGRVMVTCRVCNGTGKAKKAEVPPVTEPEVEKVPPVVTPPDLGVPPEPKPSPPPKKPEQIKRVIGIYTRSPCPACDRWLAEEANEWAYRGYEVAKLEADPTKSVPYFRVKDEHGDRVFKPGLTWAGYVLFLDSLKEKSP